MPVKEAELGEKKSALTTWLAPWKPPFLEVGVEIQALSNACHGANLRQFSRMQGWDGGHLNGG